MIVQNKRVAKEILKDHGGLFNKFDYISEDYNQTAESEKKWREASKRAMVTDRPFYPIQTKRVVKYEYPFLGKDEVSTYAFLSQNDPYELTKDEKLRAQWIEECKNLYGPFKPSGTQKPLSTVAKSQLREIVDVLKKLLLSDWNDVNFIIGSKFSIALTI